jgi:hypothetical protein
MPICWFTTPFEIFQDSACHARIVAVRAIILHFRNEQMTPPFSFLDVAHQTGLPS